MIGEEKRWPPNATRANNRFATQFGNFHFINYYERHTPASIQLK
jgi:hypothetical protein